MKITLLRNLMDAGKVYIGLGVVLCCLLMTGPAHAQDAPPVTAPMEQPLPLNIQETPLPAAVSLPSPVVAQPDVPNRPLTAAEAAAIALRYQPNIAAAEGAATAAEGRTRQAESGLMPTLAITGSHNQTQRLMGAGITGTGGTGTTSITSSNTSPYQAAVNLRVLLFDFNRTRELVRQAAALQHGAEENVNRAESDTVLQVKQAFYTLVEDQRLVTVNEANLQSQQTHLDLAKARMTAGLGLPADVVRAQAAVADAVLNLTVAHNNASLARVTLALDMGIDPLTPIVTADSDEQIPASDDVQALIAGALARRPEVLSARAVLDSAQHGVNAARVTDAPAITFGVAVTARGEALPLGSSSVVYGPSIVWDPFDGGLTAGRVAEAKGNRTTAEANLKSEQITASSDVTQAYLNLKTAEQRVTTSNAEVANAEEGARLAEGRYRAGIGIFIEITDAQAALVLARTNQVNALASVNQARATLQHAIGAPNS